MTKAKTPAPAATPSAELTALEVIQSGDVTEPKSPPPGPSEGLIEIAPMADLSDAVAKTYPGARGYTQEAGLTVLHF